MSLAGKHGGAWSADTHQELYPANLNVGLVSFIARYIGPKDFMEFGGGTAALANAVAQACELADSYVIEPEIVAPVASHRGVHLLNFDITRTAPPPVLDRKFDLVLSIEVAEHIQRSSHEALFDFLAARAGRWVVFSAARPGQGGHGHVAERPELEWRDEFVSRGFSFDARMTALARTLSDRKNINHRRNLQVFRAPEDDAGLDQLEVRARPYLAQLLKAIQANGNYLDGNLFYVDLRDAIGARPAHSLRWKRENLVRAARHAPHILEVGFNAGHAALLFLLAHPQSRVDCVDRMDHPYTRACFDYLCSEFPGRIRLLAGDSTTVLPQLEPRRYDLVHIDAGKHRTIAADLASARRLVADDHVLVIDDTQNQALDEIVLAHTTSGELEVGAFRAANVRSTRSRWTHRLARFAPRPDRVDGILAGVQDIFRDADHPSIYVNRGPDGRYLGEQRAAALAAAIRDVEENALTGAFVEVGVAAGHSSVIAALAASRFLPRDFYLFDTFSGFGELPDEKDLHGKSIREYDLLKYAAPDCGSGTVYARMRRAGVAEDRLLLVEGPAETRVAEYAPDRIAILRLDVDLYGPTLASLEAMYDRIEGGGWLIVDDYGHWQGCRQATDAFFARRGETFRGVAADYTCYLLQK